MSYFRFHIDGTISIVHEIDLLKNLSNDTGNILVVCENHSCRNALFDDAVTGLRGIKTVRFRNSQLETENSYIRFDSSPDWRCYMGIRLRSFYVHRSFTGDLMLKLASRLRDYYQGKVYQEELK